MSTFASVRTILHHDGNAPMSRTKVHFPLISRKVRIESRLRDAPSQFSQIYANTSGYMAEQNGLLAQCLGRGAVLSPDPASRQQVRKGYGASSEASKVSFALMNPRRLTTCILAEPWNKHAKAVGLTI